VVRRARALLMALVEPAKPAAPATPITRLDFAGKIADGTWRSETIAAEIPFVQLAGKGTLDLPARQLDLGLSAQVTSTPTFDDGTTLNGVAGLTLPFTVAGPMSGPKLRVDAKALARGALGEKAKDVLRDKLRGLFNR
jgi:AsmA protein